MRFSPSAVAPAFWFTAFIWRGWLLVLPWFLSPVFAEGPAPLSLNRIDISAGAAPDPRGSAAVKRVYSSVEDAAAASQQVARDIGGAVMITSGTPSMEPLIHGRTYVVLKKQPYAQIQKSDILVYMGRLDPRSPQRTCTLHRAVDNDRYGWLMSGDNNRWTESWDRVTPDNYVGTVVMIFEAAPEKGNSPARIARR